MSRKARILFVDDEKRVLNSMRGMFRRDFDLFLATDGQAAVNITSNNRIDVIVADQRMPGMSGTEVLGKVKELSPNTIRILLTGYADPAAVESSINVGEVFRFLGKPCPPKVLRDTLRVAIDAARLTANAPHVKPKPRISERASSPHFPPITASTRSVRLDLPECHSGARVDRVAAQPVETQPEILAKEIGVILYTVDAQFAETAFRAVSRQRTTTLATSLIKVMQEMEKEHTGVLVTDITSNDTRLQGIIAALKRYVPELVTVVVSNNKDSSDMINLINCGQIYRYLMKPVSPTQLRTEIGAAAIKHVSLRDNRDLIQRHAVAQFPPQYELPAPQISMLSKIQQSRALSANGSYR